MLLGSVLVGAASAVMTQARTDETALVWAPADVFPAGGGRADCMYALGVRCKVTMQPRMYSGCSLRCFFLQQTYFKAKQLCPLIVSNKPQENPPRLN